MRLLPPLACLILLLTDHRLLAEAVDFTRDVKPLFESRCISCHGPQKQRSGLRLDTAKAALEGNDAGPVIVVGKPEESLLLKALRGDDDTAIMPPKGPRLTPAEVAIVERWIREGAKAPAQEQAAVSKPVTSDHWAFQPVRRPEPPAVRDAAGVVNPIDRFIRARLAAVGLSASPEADRPTLIRRLSLDLLGLPPSPSEVAAFVADSRPDAYEQLVERLLASPHFGERQARHWLDLARYADSDGYNFDRERSIWPYRDWVIAAFNRDLPFDRFVIEQLAGDLLPNPSNDQLIATGFNRNSLFNEEGGVDPEQRRCEIVVDRVNATGTAFLGLTVGCAQCHDHKFDPISQREYYQLFAFFNSDADRTWEVVSPEERPRRDALKAQLAALRQEQAAYGKTLDAGLDAWIAGLSDADRKSLPKAVLAAVSATPEARERTPNMQATLLNYFRGLNEGYRERQKVIDELQKRLPTVPTTLVMGDLPKPRPSYVHVRGDFLRKGVKVTPTWPAVLDFANETPTAPRNRLDLARWIADPRQPLTPRVAMNRLWQQLFGLGLVETSEDYGTQGDPPSHPELLDWLASEFVRSGWSMKQMVRAIVTSATYRQSSQAREDVAEKDPRNRLLARQNRVRLDAEVVRDSALVVSGLFSRVIGGPGVHPPQPEAIQAYARTAKKWPTASGANRHRRGMYTFFYRTLPHPALIVFDAPDATMACTRRNRSTTPLQALTLANDISFYECAQALAGRVVALSGPDHSTRTDAAFQMAIGRGPTPEERAGFTAWLDKAKALPDTQTDLALWTLAGRVLLNLDEFQTRE